MIVIYNINDNVAEVDRAYAGLSQAVAEAHVANEAAIVAKCALERARAEALLAGVDGKNEAQREAQLRSLLGPQFDALAEAECAAREARHAAELAQLEVDRVRLHVRLVELVAGQGGGR